MKFLLFTVGNLCIFAQEDNPSPPSAVGDLPGSQDTSVTLSVCKRQDCFIVIQATILSRLEPATYKIRRPSNPNEGGFVSAGSLGSTQASQAGDASSSSS